MIVDLLSVPFRRALAVLGAALLGLAAAAPAPALADEARTFVIAGSDGYGVSISDCFTQGIACGRVVADAWCEAHGAGPAKAFGLASDVTASIETVRASTETADPGAVIVTCGE
jgi:hypothetical protein